MSIARHNTHRRNHGDWMRGQTPLQVLMSDQQRAELSPRSVVGTRRAHRPQLRHLVTTVRLHGTLNEVPPAEVEAAYAHPTETNQPVGSNEPGGLHRTRVDHGGKVELRALLASSATFEALSTPTTDELIAAAGEVRLAEGGVLDLAGESGDHLYILLAGSLQVREVTANHEHLVRCVTVGEAIDDLQTLAARSGTIVISAETDVRLAMVPGPAVERLSLDCADFKEVLDRIHRQQLLSSLHSILGPMDEEFLCQVEADATWTELGRGEELASANAVHLVVSGLVEVTGADESQAVEASRGDIVGELAFFAGGRADDCIRAVRPSVLAGFSDDEFERMLARRPHMLRRITRSVVERLYAEARPALVHVSVFVVVPITPGADVAAFSRRLTAALWQLGSVFHLDAEAVEREMDEPGIAQVAEKTSRSITLSTWLESRERNHRFVVYETDGRDDVWARRCLRRADRLILVGDAHGNPSPGPDERALLSETVAAPAVLVLLHADGSKPPSGAAAWLKARSGTNLVQHHHVRRDTTADFERVARFLAGQALGVALGGGGARGFAHIGALKALREAGVHFDAVGGTSMGANIAAHAAMGWSIEKMVAVNRRVWVEIAPQKRLTVPVISILGNRKSTQCGRMMFGELDIEDLWYPFYCVSSSLTTAMPYVHRGGSLLWAVTASASLPGVAVPVLEGEHLLVDGGLLDNLPTTFLHGMGCGTVIASEVTVERDSRFLRYRIPTTWEALRTRARKSLESFPSIAEVAMRAALLHSTSRQHAAIQEADLAFCPPLESFKMTDFGRIDELVEAGYRHAAELIEAWQSDRVSSEALPGRVAVADAREARG